MINKKRGVIRRDDRPGRPFGAVYTIMTDGRGRPSLHRTASYHARYLINPLISSSVSSALTVSIILSAFSRGMGSAENSAQP